MRKKLSLASKVFFAMVLGSIAGLCFSDQMLQLGFIGDIWLQCIKMVVIPMVLCTVMSGIVSQGDAAKLGKTALKIILFYFVTTVLAACVGLAVSWIIKPGTWASLSGLKGAEISGSVDLNFVSFVKGLFSSNLFATFTQGNVIQTLIIAILAGIAVLKIKDEALRNRVAGALKAAESWVFSLIGLVMDFSPIGVFFLMGQAFGKYGASVFSGIAALVGTYYLACLVHVLFIYGLFLILFPPHMAPWTFLRRSASVWMYTIATCSSVATIPVTIKTAREEFDVDENVASFTVPLGSQMNSDGSVLLYGCVIMFILQMMGQSLSFGQLMNIILLSTILSMGGGGIPGSGIVKLMVVVQSVGLPIELVGIVAAFYRLFDMGTTTNNCLGDLVGTIIVGQKKTKES